VFKLVIVILVIVLSFFPYDSTATASSISLGTWNVTGSQMWRTSFPLYPNSQGASELYYPHSGTYVTGKFETELTKNKAFSIEGGFMGNMNPAIGSDSDWNYTVGGNQFWYYGEFKTTGTAYFMSLNWIKHQNRNSQLFYGYTYQRSQYRMTDGIYYVNDYHIESPPQQLYHLNSAYTMTYQGPHIGIRSAKKISPGVSIEGSIKYTPLALAKGHGDWNLRNLTFNHTGSAQMLDTLAGLRFSLGDSSAFSLGYRYQWARLFQGGEDLSSTISWDKAINIQRGIYFTGVTRF
jgi:hypothetical protein